MPLLGQLGFGPRLPEPAYESTASRLLRESGASPVQFALPPGYAAPATPLPGLGAPARPEVASALASVRNLAAEALQTSENEWAKVTSEIKETGAIPWERKPSTRKLDPLPATELVGSFAEGLLQGANEASERLVNNMSLGYSDALGITQASRYPESEVSAAEKPLAYAANGALVAAAALATGGAVVQAPSAIARAWEAFKLTAAGSAAYARKKDADVVVAMEKFNRDEPLSKKEFDVLRGEVLKKAGAPGARTAAVALGTAKDFLFSDLPMAGIAPAALDDFVESYLAERKLEALRNSSGRQPLKAETDRLGLAAGASIAARSAEIALDLAARKVPGTKTAAALRSKAADYAAATAGGLYQNAATEFIGDEGEWSDYLLKLEREYPEFAIPEPAPAKPATKQGPTPAVRRKTGAGPGTRR